MASRFKKRLSKKVKDFGNSRKSALKMLNRDASLKKRIFLGNPYNRVLQMGNQETITVY